MVYLGMGTEKRLGEDNKVIVIISSTAVIDVIFFRGKVATVIVLSHVIRREAREKKL